MITNPLGFAGRAHLTARTRHGWSKGLQLAPDLYPGVGGKRLRALLVQRAFEFAGGRGEAPHRIIDAIEMLHAGSLVIDDFEDDSTTRRGQPSLHRVVGAARAVNAGNWMYFRALELAASAYEDPTRCAVMLKQFIEVARQCHEGQAIDLSTRADEVTPRQAEATALAISRWKTGRLVSLAAWSGADAAGGSVEQVQAASVFGCRLGICLQMKNDLDELQAFTEGGERCDDLKNRRVTWPWAWAARELSARQFGKLQQQLQRQRQRRGLRSLAAVLLAVIKERAASAINMRLERASGRLVAGVGVEGGADLFADVAGVLRVDCGTPIAEAAQCR